MKRTLIIIGASALVILIAAGAFLLGRYSQNGRQEDTSAKKNISADASQENETTQTEEKQTKDKQTEEKQAGISPSPKPVTISASGETKGEITYTISASWGDDKTTYTQIDAVITNQSDQMVEDWKVSLTIPKGSKMNQSWNSKTTQKETVLSILPEDYNAYIAVGQTVNFGFIIETPSAYVPEESELVLQAKE